MFVLTYAVYMVATPVVGILIDKYSKPTIMLVGLIITAIAFVLLGPGTTAHLSQITGLTHKAPFITFLPEAVWLNAVALAVMGVGTCIALLPTLPLMVEAASLYVFLDLKTFIEIPRTSPWMTCVPF